MTLIAFGAIMVATNVFNDAWASSSTTTCEEYAA